MALFTSHKTVQICPELLHEKAEDLRANADTAGDIFDQMQNRFLSLKEAGAWEGLAFDEAAKATAMNVSKFEGMEEKMLRLADLLDAVATKMQETDAELKAKIDAACVN